MNKIWINYDLIDKAREAKTGFSLHKYIRVVGLVNGIMVLPEMLVSCFAGKSLLETIGDVSGKFVYILFCNAAISYGYSFYRKEVALEQLRELSEKLKSVCIDTSPELLENVYQYDVEYKVDFESFPPKIIQNKYMMIPVHNDFGNNERSVKQEHVIGTMDYALSYGEPEKKNSYSYARRRMLNR